MTQTMYVLAALAVGMGSSLQVAFIGNMGRLRGATEASWINMLASVVGLAAVLGIRAIKDSPPNLPAPFNSFWTYVAALVLSGVCLAISMRGLAPYLAISGVFGFIYVFGAGWLAPKIGIALFSATVTVGTLAGSVVLDHYGAFGADVQRATLVRIVGLAALFLGVVLVRSGR
ncbi:MAG TPA: DMT family transporter [Dehalococcoidia bacterium]|nr:DMT family transporter [Dehalococcoidia bacterium]